MPLPSVVAVGKLLSGAWNAEVVLGEMVQVEPWSVARCQVVDGPVDSVIVKWVRDGDPDDPGARSHPAQLATESCALRFLEDVGTRAPRLVAASQDLLIMEDLVGYVALDELIRQEGYNERTHGKLLETAQLLADRHIRTRAAEDMYYRRLAEQISVDRVGDRQRFLGRAWQRVRETAAALGCPPGDRAIAEAGDLRQRLVTPGPFLALSNGDSASNNVLVGSSESVIIDFEFAGYRHCLSDLADFILPGPRWVTLAETATRGFIDAYRTALAVAVPEGFNDARFGVEIAAVGLTHAFGRLANFATIDARPAGDLSRLERLITVEAAADLAQAQQTYPALVHLCQQLGLALRHRWPETNIHTERLSPFMPRR